MRIKQPWDHLIFMMGIFILIRWHLYIDICCWDINGIIAPLWNQLRISRQSCLFFMPQGPKNDCLIYFKYWFHKLLSRTVLQPTMNLKYSYIFLCMKGVWQGVLLCHDAGCHRWCIDCPYDAAKCTLQSCEIFRYFRPLKKFQAI